MSAQPASSPPRSPWPGQAPASTPAQWDSSVVLSTVLHMYDKLVVTYKEFKYYLVWSKKWLMGLVMNSFSVFGTHAQSIFLLCVRFVFFWGPYIISSQNWLKCWPSKVIHNCLNVLALSPNTPNVKFRPWSRILLSSYLHEERKVPGNDLTANSDRFVPCVRIITLYYGKSSFVITFSSQKIKLQS